MNRFLSGAGALMLLMGSAAASAQTITTDDVARMRANFGHDASTTALRNAITNTGDLRQLALNRDMVGAVDHHFSYRVDVSGITNQYGSGRCWMFTSMNVLRPSVMERYNIDAFDFSHNYLYFWDMLEKSNLFLENCIATADKPMDDRDVENFFKSPVSDGGVWNLYWNAAEKYGVVPDTVMPETVHSNNTAQLGSILNEKLRMEGYRLREIAAQSGRRGSRKALEEAKQAALDDVYRILALCLGEPPTVFTWRFRDRDGKIVEKTCTPQEFYREIIPADYTPDNYIMIMNDPTREYYRLYEIANYRNTYEGINWIYLNLPSEDIKKAAIESIRNNEAMYASCDVNKFLNRDEGVMDPAMYDYESLFGVSLSMDKKTRILTRQSGSSHAMTLIGVDVDAEGEPVKWEFENSWGPEIGHEGYLTFTDDWFDEYMFRIVIHRRYLDAKAVGCLNQTPVMLPAWDYMF